MSERHFFHINHSAHPERPEEVSFDETFETLLTRQEPESILKALTDHVKASEGMSMLASGLSVYGERIIEAAKEMPVNPVEHERLADTTDEGVDAHTIPGALPNMETAEFELEAIQESHLNLLILGEEIVKIAHDAVTKEEVLESLEYIKAKLEQGMAPFSRQK